MTTALADVLRYRTVDTPVGTLLLTSSDRGLIRVAVATEGHDRVLADHTTTAARALARGHDVRHRVFFADEATAVAAGYRPCAVCLRDRYTAWRCGTR